MPRHSTCAFMIKQKTHWSERTGRFKIRHSDHTPLWKKHPNTDIAVMYVSVPFSPFERVIPTTLLADDDTLKRYTMAPGTELNCLGYPLGDKGPVGFPILRTGVIASYLRAVRRFDEREKPPNGGQTQRVEIQIIRV